MVGGGVREGGANVLQCREITVKRFSIKCNESKLTESSQVLLVKYIIVKDEGKRWHDNSKEV